MSELKLICVCTFAAMTNLATVATVFGQYGSAILDQQSVNRQFNGPQGWNNVSSQSQLVTGSDGNTALFLNGAGGWSQFIPLNGAADYHLVSILARRSNLDHPSSGWAGFGVTYYDEFFNTIDVVSREIKEAAGTISLSELRYEISTRIPDNAVFANIWVWNSNNTTSTTVDEFSIAHFFPDNDVLARDGVLVDPRKVDRNLISNGTFQQYGRYQDDIVVGLSGTSFWSTDVAENGTGIQFRSGFLEVGARDCATSLWQNIDVAANTTYELRVDALRRNVQGGFSPMGRPWASIGVDFYDSNWQFLSKEVIAVNDVTASAEVDLLNYFVNNPATVKTASFSSPAGARYASCWIWIEGSGPERFVPLVVRSLRLRAVGLDVSPPTAAVTREPITTGGATQIGFDILITEPSGLGANVPGAEATVSGPNGYRRDVVVLRSLGIGNGTTVLISTVDAPGGQLGREDNGIYTVTILAGQIQDIYGNFMPQQQIGTIEVNIP